MFSVVPIHKKGDKQPLLNYQAVSPLPVCSKIFELFSTLSSNISKGKVFSPNQSGFCPFDSCEKYYQYQYYKYYQ